MVPGVYTIAFEFSDQAGNAAQSLTRTVTVYNDAPNGLTLSTNRVEENLPGGTAVGNFSVSDPNDPEGKGTYVFELLEAGTPPSFALESNGSLRTLRSLDFEEATAHARRFGVDAYGGTERFHHRSGRRLRRSSHQRPQVGETHMVAAGEGWTKAGVRG